jgi:hypothetical protein
MTDSRFAEADGLLEPELPVLSLQRPLSRQAAEVRASLVAAIRAHEQDLLLTAIRREFPEVFAEDPAPLSEGRRGVCREVPAPRSLNSLRDAN